MFIQRSSHAAKEKMNPTVIIAVAFMLNSAAFSSSCASEFLDQPTEELIVGTKDAPPFAMKTPEGQWQGISIELWTQIAKELELKYRFEESDLSGLLAGVESGHYSLAAAALTVTPEREIRLDFSHPFHTAGLGIAVKIGHRAGPLDLLGRFLSIAFFKAVAALIIILFLVAVVIWLFEKRRNSSQFGGSVRRGLGAGFWWSAVTMTTVGYGDKAPVTFGGRIVAVLWMFTSVIIVSSLTGAIAASLAVGQMEDIIRGPADLANVRVGVVADSTAESYLRERHLRYKEYQTAEAGLEAIISGQIEAIVYDEPLLKFLVNTKFPNLLRVIPGTFQREDYVFAMPAGTNLRESVNRVLIKKIQHNEWQHTLFRYLGPPQ